MKKFLTAYFNLSSREYNGFLLLAGVILALIVYLNVSHLFLQPEQELIIENLASDSTLVAQADTNRNHRFHTITDQLPLHLRNFDPNSISGAEMASMGFSEKLVKTIVNFRNKGGRFYKKEDFSRIYGVSEQLYRKVEKYLVLPEKQWQEKNRVSHEPKRLAVNINSADSAALVELPLVGPVLASRIVKYREKLGGFYSTSQLREVFGITDSTCITLAPRIIVEGSLRMIDINSCSEKELASHPYAGRNIAKALIAMRNRKGGYSKVSEIKECVLITDDLFGKLERYIEVK